MSIQADNLIVRGYVEVSPGVWEKPWFLPPDGQPARVEGPIDRERDLHDRIEADLINRRLYYVHSRMDKKTTTKLGVPDFIIAAGNGKTLWAEIKRKGGKLSAEQNVAKHCLIALDHKHVVIYSFTEYLKAIGEL